jgi:hypothetical protein
MAEMSPAGGKSRELSRRAPLERMSNQPDTEINAGQPLVYQIRIRGHLGRQWEDWFGGLTITLEEHGETLLTGAVMDQATLHGLLRKVRDLGMLLVSVNGIEPGQTEAPITVLQPNSVLGRPRPQSIKKPQTADTRQR